MTGYILPSGGQIELKFISLANTHQDRLFHRRRERREWADLLGVTVTAGTGTAGNATVAIYKAAPNSEKVILYQGCCRCDIPLELVGAPATHLEVGDIVRVTGAANQEVCVTYAYGTRTPDDRRQA